MADLHGFPYFEIEFTRDGKVHKDAQVIQALAGMTEATDLVVLAHGWNNDRAEARRLYTAIAARMQAAEDADVPKGIDDREIVLLGVFWPSKRFAAPELIPGGGARALASGLTVAELRKQITTMRALFDKPAERAILDRAGVLLPDLERDPKARKAFADLIRRLMPPSYADEDARAIPATFKTTPGDRLLDRLARPLPLEPPPGGRGRTRSSAKRTRVTKRDLQRGAFGDFIGGIKAGAQRLMNLVTYYQMKDRAGVVGAKGLAGVLRRIRKQAPDLKIHLVGHSFGGRLVTAAATEVGAAPVVRLGSIALLQAAFSHFGFAKRYEAGKDGFFRPMIELGHLDGPVIITHSVKDKAVGMAYPIASRLGNQVARAFGDAADPFGGIGRNGAQRTPEASPFPLLRPPGVYDLRGGALHNLNGDSLISGHSDVANPAVVHAVLSAIAAS
jgi:hypothetical protein